MSKDNNKLIKFYKGIVLQQIFDHLKTTDQPMTKDQIDTDIKINAGFEFDSCAHEDVEPEDLQNLIIWGFLYGDECGVFIEYPQNQQSKELDNKLRLNFDRMAKEQRYAVTVDFYIWTDSDEDAIKQAQEFAEKQERENSNRCNVVSVYNATSHKPFRVDFHTEE